MNNQSATNNNSKNNFQNKKFADLLRRNMKGSTMSSAAAGATQSSANTTELSGMIEKQRYYLNRSHLPIYLRHPYGKLRYYTAWAGTMACAGMTSWLFYSMFFGINKDPESPINAAN